jgi:hypothetical protein
MANKPARVMFECWTNLDKIEPDYVTKQQKRLVDWVRAQNGVIAFRVTNLENGTTITEKINRYDGNIYLKIAALRTQVMA